MSKVFARWPKPECVDRLHDVTHNEKTDPRNKAENFKKELTMNVQERDALLKFLASLRQTPVQSKDAVADSIIRDALSQQPDALYKLVQRSMALQLALDAALDKLKQHETTVEPVQDKPQTSSWGTGLLAQAGTVALGTAVGVAAGGLLLQSVLPDSLDLGDSFFD